MTYITRFSFCWFILTLFYLAVYFLNIQIVAGVVGLFVPYGVWNSIMTFGSISNYNFFPVVTFLLFIGTLFYADRFATYAGISRPGAKIMYNLLLLLALTLIIDISIWGEWMSWSVITNTGLGPM